MSIQKTFTVPAVYQQGKRLSGVNTIKAKEIANNNWILVAEAGSGPQLIFPSGLVKRSPRTISNNRVSITLDIEPEIEVTIEFDSFVNASKFHEFVGTFGTSKDDMTDVSIRIDP